MLGGAHASKGATPKRGPTRTSRSLAVSQKQSPSTCSLMQYSRAQRENSRALRLTTTRSIATGCRRGERTMATSMNWSCSRFMIDGPMLLRCWNTSRRVCFWWPVSEEKSYRCCATSTDHAPSISMGVLLITVILVDFELPIFSWQAGYGPGFACADGARPVEDVVQ